MCSQNWFNGHKSHRGKHTILDVNECLDANGGCEHFCNNVCGNVEFNCLFVKKKYVYIIFNIKLKPGGYRCSCKDGYVLDTDNHHCVGLLKKKKIDLIKI